MGDNFFQTTEGNEPGIPKYQISCPKLMVFHKIIHETNHLHQKKYPGNVYRWKFSAMLKKFEVTKINGKFAFFNFFFQKIGLNSLTMQFLIPNIAYK